MSDIAIRVNGIGKRYRIGARREKYPTLRDRLAGFIPRKRAGREPLRDFWALRNVSLELKPGRVLGVVGSNGAGKSTLLKILSRITEPTEGSAELHGRVGSLLEVGTGFHPELTGRENVFLNGAVLGMRRHEIEKKFDEIVGFSGIDTYIDTPVKRYSTGMYLRLAFSVAAHLESEILLVDEVLAVGDQSFQSKCMGKIGEAVHEGRTVLLVSHNMAAIKQLADEVLLIDRGQVAFHGDPSEGIRQYFERTSCGNSNPEVSTAEWTKRSGSGQARITKVKVADERGVPATSVGTGRPFRVSLEADVVERLPIVIPGIEIRTAHGILLLAMRSDFQQRLFGPFDAGTRIRIDIDVPGIPAYPGEYVIDVWIAAKIAWKVDHLQGALTLNFVSQGVFECESNLNPRFERGLIIADGDWRVRAVEKEAEKPGATVAGD